MIGFFLDAMETSSKHTLKTRIAQLDIDRDTLDVVHKLLGREPRGMLGLYCSEQTGLPAVVEVSCLVDLRPFPTLYWLIEPAICYWLDRLEAQGVIRELQAVIDASQLMRSAMRADHDWYRDQRIRLSPEEDLRRLSALGFSSTLQQKGIGGISKPDRVRCLHTWYASHLVKPNTVGRWIDAHPDYTDAF